MPYINKMLRNQLDAEIEALAKDVELLLLDLDAENIDGIVNYVITRILTLCYHPMRYHTYNRMLGVLEAVKLELYRRGVAPYEDVKMREHGDVYG